MIFLNTVETTNNTRIIHWLHQRFQSMLYLDSGIGVILKSACIIVNQLYCSLCSCYTMYSSIENMLKIYLNKRNVKLQPYCYCSMVSCSSLDCIVKYVLGCWIYYPYLLFWHTLTLLIHQIAIEETIE